MKTTIYTHAFLCKKLQTHFFKDSTKVNFSRVNWARAITQPAEHTHHTHTVSKCSCPSTQLPLQKERFKLCFRCMSFFFLLYLPFPLNVSVSIQNKSNTENRSAFSKPSFCGQLPKASFPIVDVRMHIQ